MRRFVLGVMMLGTTMISKGQDILSATQYNHGVVTASGSKINHEKLRAGKLRWVALSRELIKKYPFGTVLVVKSEKYPELNGEWIVKDKMGPKHKSCIDFLIARGKSKLGRTRVEIRKKDVE